MSAPARRRGALVALAAIAPAFALLVGLGVWQLRRLHWKLGLIAEVAARVHAAPADLPAPADWPALKPEAYDYAHVRATGAFDYSHEAKVFRALGSPKGRYGGPGYLVVTPFALAGGATVLVNRGFVPQGKDARADRAASEIAGATTITGLMRPPEWRTWFTPADEPAKGLWFTLDPASIAAGLGVARAAPFIVDEDAGQAPGGLPQGGETVLSFPNNHLSYAFTWFGLAATLLVVSGLYAWKARPA
ncbi:MAG: SURF1 family protein [Hyphomicrobiales bacterium]|nr:SURF1 family protein [Hyphomicrobiales bacterium]MDE2018370.1 SURF1 family protein [Hyphomicrobiales bacterium]